MKKKVCLLIGTAVLAALALIPLLRWKPLTSVSDFHAITDETITEIALRKSVTLAESAVFSDDDLIQMWTDALNSMEVRWAGFIWDAHTNGGGRVVEIKTEQSEFSFKLRARNADGTYQLRIGNVLYTIKNTESIPFEETYDTAVARHGVKTPWD